MAENKVKFGLKNVHIAPITAEKIDCTAEAEDAYTYGDWFKFPGAVSFTGTSKSSSTNFYAQDGVYAVVYADNGYDISFEMARLTNEFKKKILNEKDGRQIASAKPVAFALAGEISGDKENTRFIFWRCEIAKRPDFNAKTNEDAPTPQTDTLTAVAGKRPDTEDIKAEATPDYDVYETMFNTVPKPSDFKAPTTGASEVSST